MNMIKPMLCKEYLEPFDSPGFIWETKYDGNRIIAVNGRLFARSGRERTVQFPELDIRTKVSAILDGEIVSAGGGDISDVQRRNRTSSIVLASKEYPAEYKVFDVLEAGGVNLEDLPLMKRKEMLRTILIPTDNVAESPYTECGVALFQQIRQRKAQGLGGEGVIGKRKLGAYLRNKREWLKVKCWQVGYFLVVGYTKGTGWRESTFGALVLSDMKGNYVGSVGTGFSDATIASIRKVFLPSLCPFVREPEPATWVKPFRVRIRYLELTNDGRLRFPSFKV